MHSPAETLAPLYPRIADFRELRAALDPDGKFANDFLRAHVIGDTQAVAPAASSPAAILAPEP
jgi:hypothetical protein